MATPIKMGSICTNKSPAKPTSPKSGVNFRFMAHKQGMAEVKEEKLGKSDPTKKERKIKLEEIDQESAFQGTSKDISVKTDVNLFNRIASLKSSMSPHEVLLFQLLSEKDKDFEIQSLLEQIPFRTLLYTHNMVGYSVLHIACCNNNSKYVQILL